MERVGVSDYPGFRAGQLSSFKPFRFINHQRIPSFIKVNDFLIKIDFKNVSFHIPIQERYHHLLAFII